MVSRRQRGRRAGDSAGRRRRPAAGYNLVILMVLVTVMTILVAVSLPLWSQVMRREREQELIFRGLQYAEAIRVFQVRAGRYPVSLRELLENEPRAIRQLWTDPFRDDGKWGLILQAEQRGSPLTGQQQQQQQRLTDRDRGREDDEEVGTLRDEEGKPLIPVEDVGEDGRWAGRLSDQGAQAAGPIIGVRSLTEKEAVRTFLGSNQISQWEFTADLIPVLPAAPGLDSVPRLTSRYIGRPFPEGIEVQAGSAPGDAFENEDNRSGSRQDRRNRQNRSSRQNRQDSQDRRDDRNDR